MIYGGGHDSIARDSRTCLTARVKDEGACESMHKRHIEDKRKEKRKGYFLTLYREERKREKQTAVAERDIQDRKQSCRATWEGSLPLRVTSFPSTAHIPKQQPPTPGTLQHPASLSSCGVCRAQGSQSICCHMVKGRGTYKKTASVTRKRQEGRGGRMM